DPTLRRQRVRRQILGRELRKALATGTLDVALQPQLSIREGHHLGFEALLRWRLRRHDIDPIETIAIAEEENLIGKLSARIIDKALSHVAAL
ncbi:EAL domain-containing protein, partial [Acinetobacter baumannii]